MFTIYLFNGIIYLTVGILLCCFPETMRNVINKRNTSEIRAWGIFIGVTGMMLCGNVVLHVMVCYKIFVSIFEEYSILPLWTWIVLIILALTGVSLLILGAFFVFTPYKTRDKISKLPFSNLRVYCSILLFTASIFFFLFFCRCIFS